MYVSSEEFYSAHPELADKGVYDKCGMTAQRWIDRFTMGVDLVKKLAYAFPTNEDDAKAVKDCWIELCLTAWRIEEARSILEAGVQTINGAIVPQLVSSISSGSESISFATNGAGDNQYVRCAKDNSAGLALASSIVREMLSGYKDANGVNLLYLGRYPY